MNQTIQAIASCEWNWLQLTRTQRRPKALHRIREQELLASATTRPEAPTRAIICKLDGGGVVSRWREK